MAAANHMHRYTMYSRIFIKGDKKWGGSGPPRPPLPTPIFCERLISSVSIAAVCCYIHVCSGNGDISQEKRPLSL